MLTYKVFISSTVYDLHELRASVKTAIESFKPQFVRFSCMVSDQPDFQITPSQRAKGHSYNICIEKVRECDLFLLFLKKRYGTPIIDFENTKISITHLEYREAYRFAKPLFTFVDKRLWDARNELRKGHSQQFVPSKELRLFDFLEEIIKSPRANWMHPFSSLADVTRVLSTTMLRFDDTVFINDITIPDGSLIPTNASFEKIWEIKNNGVVVWGNRYLREVNSGASGLTPIKTEIRIPRTKPGEHVRIKVVFTAPSLPCNCESHWKMFDSYGKLCFPNHSGLFCKVKVFSQIR